VRSRSPFSVLRLSQTFRRLCGLISSTYLRELEDWMLWTPNTRWRIVKTPFNCGTRDAALWVIASVHWQLIMRAIRSHHHSPFFNTFRPSPHLPTTTALMSVHQSDWRLGRTTHFSPTYISASTKIIALYIGALGAGVIISTFTLLIYQYFLSLCRLRPQLTHKNGGKVGENFKFRAVTLWFWKCTAFLVGFVI